MNRYEYIGIKVNNFIKLARVAKERISEFPLKDVYVYWNPSMDKYAAFGDAGNHVIRKELCKIGVLHKSIVGDRSCNEKSGWIPLVWPEGESPLYKCARLTTTPAQLSLAGGLVGGTAGGLWSLWMDRNSKLPLSDRLKHAILPVSIGTVIGTTPGLANGWINRCATQKRNSDGSWSKPDVGLLEAMFLDDIGLRKKSPTYNANRALHDAQDDVAFVDDSVKTASFSDASALGPLDTGNSSLIHVDNFNRVVWDDANSGFTQPENALLVTSALNASRPNGSTFVTPGAVIGTLVNAGIGWATAGVIGKTLGALGGLSEPHQQKLREIGTWGGIINGVGQSMLH